MIPLLERLKQPKALVADGAMGTILIQRGLKEGDIPERFNLEKSEMLEEIAREYMDAGAEIIQTNTFGASPLKLASFGLAEKTEEINSRAVRAVRKAVSSRAYVSASCGPSGKLLEPYGDVSYRSKSRSQVHLFHLWKQGFYGLLLILHQFQNVHTSHK